MPPSEIASALSGLAELGDPVLRFWKPKSMMMLSNASLYGASVPAAVRRKTGTIGSAATPAGLVLRSLNVRLNLGKVLLSGTGLRVPFCHQRTQSRHAVR